MKIPHYLDEEALSALLAQQKQLAWDIDAAFAWRGGVDFSKPFVPLDADNIAFPEVTPKERLAISQFMGMIIAATIGEMETTMQRMRETCWRPLMRRYAVNPELIALGEEFFEEEEKHSRVFQRFLDLCAHELDVDGEALKNILPRVNPGYVEAALRANALFHGVALWWIVATVEEESVLIYRQMKPHEDKLDPLYFSIHRRHFEEEARHAPYPFLMFELGKDRGTSALNHAARKTDFVVSQILKVFWMFFELGKTLDVGKLKNHHPFFRTLSGLIPKLKERSLTSLIASFARSTPYISTFINPLYHPQTKMAVARRGVFTLPFPQPQEAAVGW